jgi:hypothetical protein
MNYMEFLEKKKIAARSVGMANVPELNSKLFGHQAHSVDYALRKGRCGLFLDTGLGKTACELEYANQVLKSENKSLLFFAPLAVSDQHILEGEKFGIEIKKAVSQEDVKGTGIYITNYERIHLFDKTKFCGTVLDESSIIKSFNGKTSRALMDFCEDHRWRLAASATPAPNDHMELGQHSQLLGAMASNEMLARFFIADQSEMGRYRLKKHGIMPFWRWVASWARCAGLPSDLGFSDDGYILPKLNENLLVVETDMTKGREDGEFFRKVEMSATNIHKEKRITSMERAEKIAEKVLAEPDEPWMIWVETDYDSESIKSCLPDLVEVHGRMKMEEKEEKLTAFTNGNIKRLVSKPSIAGYGLNWQHCARTGFVGLSFSYEQYYQAIRRFYRFGQKREVDCYVAIANSELPIWQTVQRKKKEHEEMKKNMFVAMKEASLDKHVKHAYEPQEKAIMPLFLGV